MPLLHVLKEHPFVLKRYQPIFNNQHGVSSLKPVNKNHFFSSFRQKITTLVVACQNSLRKKSPLPKVDVVFVSHLVSDKHLKSGDDFYFSNLPSLLKSRGITSLIVLINHTDKDSDSLLRKIDPSEIPRVIVPAKLGCIKEVRMLTGLIRELISMYKDSTCEEHFKRNSLRFLSRFSNATGALFGLRISSYINEVFNCVQPSAVMTIYEGHAWERLVYDTAAKNNIFRAGYQHSVVTQNSHAMCRSLGVDYDPDVIYTSGSITNKHLSQGLKAGHTRVATLGSNKLSNMKQAPMNKQSLKTCLVIPEGLYDECEILFEFTLQCANKLPDVDFIWRLHPQLSFEKVLSEISLNRQDLPNNIIVSDSSLDEDIYSSTHAIYRGSTAIVEAVYGGLLPIYLSDGSDMTIDLLYDLDSGRKIVRDFSEFASAINEQSKKDLESAKHYCEEYFSPLDVNILIRDIKGRLKT